MNDPLVQLLVYGTGLAIGLLIGVLFIFYVLHEIYVILRDRYLYHKRFTGREDE